MIDPLNNSPYIISFPQGASGRFAKYLLHNLLTDSDFELYPCPYTNSAHRTDDQLYTGYTPNFGDNSRPDIWEKFQFDSGSNVHPRIFPTHQFPNFKLIRERLGTDVKIIIITVDPLDLVEVMINDRVKNIYDLLNGTSVDPHQSSMEQLFNQYSRFLNKRYPGKFELDDIIQIGKSISMDFMPYFVKRTAEHRINADIGHDYEKRLEKFVVAPELENMDYSKDQLLILPYYELHRNWRWLEKLEAFTGKTANTATKSSYQRYIEGRIALLKKYRL